MPKMKYTDNNLDKFCIMWREFVKNFNKKFGTIHILNGRNIDACSPPIGCHDPFTVLPLVKESIKQIHFHFLLLTRQSDNWAWMSPQHRREGACKFFSFSSLHTVFLSCTVEYYPVSSLISQCLAQGAKKFHFAKLDPSSGLLLSCKQNSFIVCNFTFILLRCFRTNL